MLHVRAFVQEVVSSVALGPLVQQAKNMASDLK